MEIGLDLPFTSHVTKSQRKKRRRKLNHHNSKAQHSQPIPPASTAPKTSKKKEKEMKPTSKSEPTTPVWRVPAKLNLNLSPLPISGSQPEQQTSLTHSSSSPSLYMTDSTGLVHFDAFHRSNNCWQNMVIFSFDIEKLGNTFTHGMVSIGAVAFLLTPNPANWTLLDLKIWNIAIDHTNPMLFDADCMRNFWNKHPGLLESLQVDASPLADVLRELRDWIDSFQQLGTYYNVSDNPCFDIGHINYELERHHLRNINYKQQTFVQTLAPDDMYNMIPKHWRDFFSSLFNAMIPYSERAEHNPLKDAMHVLNMYLASHCWKRSFLQKQIHQIFTNITHQYRTKLTHSLSLLQEKKKKEEK